MQSRELSSAPSGAIDIADGLPGSQRVPRRNEPATRGVVWELCQANYHDQGIRLFWLDEAEPEYGGLRLRQLPLPPGPERQVGNIYPQILLAGVLRREEAAGQEKIVNLVRCAWAGSQRYGALVWSGDIHSTFEELRRQITAGLHMGMAGIPWLTTDIGGFHGGNIGDADFRELLVRWFQFGAFCPVMRMHGDRAPFEEVVAADGSERCRTGAPNELWSFGDEVYEILAHYVRLREAMRPYTRAVMEQAHAGGQPVMRGMFHEFPEDPICWDVADQYMFGPDLLVAPVVEPHAVSRRVYLPGRGHVDRPASRSRARWRAVDHRRHTAARDPGVPSRRCTAKLHALI